VKTQLLKSYETQIRAKAAACKRISNLYQGSRSVLDYFSEVRQVCKALIKLTPKDHVTDIMFLQEIIQEVAGAAVNVTIKLNAVILNFDANKQALKKQWGEKIAHATANFIMVQIFIEGLKLEFKNEMIKTSCVSLAQAFDRAKELEKHAEQKELAATKINETSVDYMSSTSKRSQGAQKGQKGKSEG
jgi:hypothetical protein